MEFGVKKEGNFNQNAGYSRIQGSIREDEYRNPSGPGSFFALMVTTLCDPHLNFRQWDLPVLITAQRDLSGTVGFFTA